MAVGPALGRSSPGEESVGGWVATPTSDLVFPSVEFDSMFKARRTCRQVDISSIALSPLQLRRAYLWLFDYSMSVVLRQHARGD